MKTKKEEPSSEKSRAFDWINNPEQSELEYLDVTRRGYGYLKLKNANEVKVGKIYRFPMKLESLGCIPKRLRNGRIRYAF